MTRKKKIEIWFQDEARIGQKNGLVRQWARRGTRPIQPADQRYESAYLFGAICPARGVGAALALPFADTDAMQRHIDEIALHVARGAHAVLLLDRAGWHTTGKLVWPRNVTPILLPSPGVSWRVITWPITCISRGTWTKPNDGWRKVYTWHKRMVHPVSNRICSRRGERLRWRVATWTLLRRVLSQD